MGFLDKFKKKEGFEDDDFPSIEEINKEPALGPAAFSNPNKEQGSFPAPQMNPQPTSGLNPNSLSMQSTQNSLNIIQSKVELLISRIEAFKLTLDSLSQKIYKIEQILTYQKQQPAQPSSSFNQQTSPNYEYGSQKSSPYGQSSGQSYPNSQPTHQQTNEKKDEDSYVWPF